MGKKLKAELPAGFSKKALKKKDKREEKRKRRKAKT